jgi:hypothetical protein
MGHSAKPITKAQNQNIFIKSLPNSQRNSEAKKSTYTNSSGLGVSQPYVKSLVLAKQSWFSTVAYSAERFSI